MAAEIAYYTYMYAKVEKSKYQKVTGHARAAILSGRFLASVLAQLIVSFDWMDLRELNYISLGGKYFLKNKLKGEQIPKAFLFQQLKPYL